MSSTIRTTIESVISERVGRLPAGYQSVVDGVIEAVEGLAASAADSLRESGRALGASEEQVEGALVSAGLVEPEPVVEETVADGGRLASLERKVDALIRAAESRFGFRV